MSDPTTTQTAQDRLAAAQAAAEAARQEVRDAEAALATETERDRVALVAAEVKGDVDATGLFLATVASRFGYSMTGLLDVLVGRPNVPGAWDVNA